MAKRSGATNSVVPQKHPLAQIYKLGERIGQRPSFLDLPCMPHERHFTYQVTFDGKTVLGHGATKIKAKMAAAECVLKLYADARRSPVLTGCRPTSCAEISTSVQSAPETIPVSATDPAPTSEKGISEGQDAQTSPTGSATDEPVHKKRKPDGCRGVLRHGISTKGDLVEEIRGAHVENLSEIMPRIPAPSPRTRIDTGNPVAPNRQSQEGSSDDSSLSSPSVLRISSSLFPREVYNSSPSSRPQMRPAHPHGPPELRPRQIDLGSSTRPLLTGRPSVPVPAVTPILRNPCDAIDPSNLIILQSGPIVKSVCLAARDIVLRKLCSEVIQTRIRVLQDEKAARFRGLAALSDYGQERDNKGSTSPPPVLQFVSGQPAASTELKPASEPLRDTRQVVPACVEVASRNVKTEPEIPETRLVEKLTSDIKSSGESVRRRPPKALDKIISRERVPQHSPDSGSDRGKGPGSSSQRTPVSGASGPGSFGDILNAAKKNVPGGPAKKKDSQSPNRAAKVSSSLLVVHQSGPPRSETGLKQSTASSQGNQKSVTDSRSASGGILRDRVLAVMELSASYEKQAGNLFDEKVFSVVVSGKADIIPPGAREKSPKVQLTKSSCEPLLKPSSPAGESVKTEPSWDPVGIPPPRTEIVAVEPSLSAKPALAASRVDESQPSAKELPLSAAVSVKREISCAAAKLSEADRSTMLVGEPPDATRKAAEARTVVLTGPLEQLDVKEEKRKVLSLSEYQERQHKLRADLISAACSNAAAVGNDDDGSTKVLSDPLPVTRSSHPALVRQIEPECPRLETLRNHFEKDLLVDMGDIDRKQFMEVLMRDEEVALKSVVPEETQSEVVSSSTSRTVSPRDCFRSPSSRSSPRASDGPENNVQMDSREIPRVQVPRVQEGKPAPKDKPSRFGPKYSPTRLPPSDREPSRAAKPGRGGFFARMNVVSSRFEEIPTAVQTPLEPVEVNKERKREKVRWPGAPSVPPASKWELAEERTVAVVENTVSCGDEKSRVMVAEIMEKKLSERDRFGEERTKRSSPSEKPRRSDHERTDRRRCPPRLPDRAVREASPNREPALKMRKGGSFFQRQKTGDLQPKDEMEEVSKSPSENADMDRDRARSPGQSRGRTYVSLPQSEPAESKAEGAFGFGAYEAAFTREMLDVKYIDSHSHWDFFLSKTGDPALKLYRDVRSKYKEFFPSSYAGAIQVFCSPNQWGRRSDFARQRLMEGSENEMWYTFGCHPSFVKDWNAETKNDLHECLKLTSSKDRLVGFGEIGLDYHGTNRTEEMKKLQQSVLEEQLDIAVQMQVPIVVHCRDEKFGGETAEEDCFRILQKKVPQNFRIHRHCFDGTIKQTEEYLKHFPNMRFGITPLMRNYAKKDMVRLLPLDRILLETDAPYFSPSEITGLPKDRNGNTMSVPGGCALATAWEIAQIKKVPLERVLQQTYDNTVQLYDLKIKKSRFSF